MSIATIDVQPRVEGVEFSGHSLSIRLHDGRMISAPLSWYPRLQAATPQEQGDWEILQDSDDRDIIHWERLDEFIPVIALLTGTPSRESKRSFELWLKGRKTNTQ